MNSYDTWLEKPYQDYWAEQDRQEAEMLAALEEATEEMSNQMKHCTFEKGKPWQPLESFEDIGCQIADVFDHLDDLRKQSYPLEEIDMAIEAYMDWVKAMVLEGVKRW